MSVRTMLARTWLCTLLPASCYVAHTFKNEGMHTTRSNTYMNITQPCITYRKCLVRAWESTCTAVRRSTGTARLTPLAAAAAHQPVTSHSQATTQWTYRAGCLLC